MARSFCTECGAHLEAGQHFCGECGHPVPAEPATEPATETPPTEAAGGAETSEAGTASPAGEDTTATTPVGSAAAAAVGPAQPASGPAASTGAKGGRRWIALVVVVALIAGGIAGALVLTSGGESAAQEITLEPADSSGSHPFTASSETTPPPASTESTIAPPPTVDTNAQGTTIQGGATGLYGGSLNQGSCDVEGQIDFLTQNPDKAAAFAGVLGISVQEIPRYLRSLTPVVLRYDTRVTNHGYVDGKATAFQAVLQAGTAVLVDEYGVPRVKCNCGNPLTPPVDLADHVTYHGDMWDGFSLPDTVIVINNTTVINVFVIVEFDLDILIDRDAGTTGDSDGTHGGTTGGGTTGGGTGGTLGCGGTADVAVSRLLAARRANDQTAATQACSSPNPIQYLWSLSDSVARGLTASACVEPANVGDPYNTGAELRECTLSNGATLIVEQYAPAASGWIVEMVIPTGGTGGGTTVTTAQGGDEGGAVLCSTTAQGAAETVLAARRTNRRADAEGCALPAVLDKLFANTLDWSGVTISRCDSSSPTETVANVVAAQMCYLSNGFRLEVWKSSLPIQWYVGKLWLPGV